MHGLSAHLYLFIQMSWISKVSRIFKRLFLYLVYKSFVLLLLTAKAPLPYSFLFQSFFLFDLFMLQYSMYEKIWLCPKNPKNSSQNKNCMGQSTYPRFGGLNYLSRATCNYISWANNVRFTIDSLKCCIEVVPYYSLVLLQLIFPRNNEYTRSLITNALKHPYAR